MQPIQVHSTKYDGSKHYRFAAGVVDQSADCISVYSSPGTKLDCYRGQLTSRSHNLRLYWPDRHWNLSVRWRRDWSLEDYYINIAAPATWDTHTINWVDLDLDLIWTPYAAEPLLDDENEFTHHAAVWQYPAELVERCWAAVEEVRQAMRHKSWPFDGSLLVWRPTGLT